MHIEIDSDEIIEVVVGSRELIDAVNDVIEDYDFNSAVESAVDDAIDRYDFSGVVADELRDLVGDNGPAPDQSARIEVLEARCDKLGEVLDLATKLLKVLKD